MLLFALHAMCRDLMVTQVLDEFLAVIALVGAQGHPLLAGDLLHQLDRRLRFGVSARQVDASSHLPCAPAGLQDRSSTDGYRCAVAHRESRRWGCQGHYPPGAFAPPYPCA